MQDERKCYCSGAHGHLPYVSEMAIRRAGERHQEGVKSGKVKCRPCKDGFVPKGFQCRVDQRQWHWGHGVV